MGKTKQFKDTIRSTIKSLSEGILLDMKNIRWASENGSEIKDHISKAEKKTKRIIENAYNLYYGDK